MSAVGWKTKPLGDLFYVGAGKTMSAAARSGDDKVPFLRTSNVLWDEVDLSEVDEMAIPEHELADKQLEPGDLLVCEGGAIGRAAIWEGGPTPMSFQNHLHRLRPKSDDVDPRFYVYFLQSAFTQLGIFEGAGNKTTIPNLSSGRLKALNLPHPSFPEQNAIANSLRHVQRARRLNDRLIATVEELKAAAMQRLFSQGLRGEAQKETEIGPLPESWVLDRLDAFADVISTRMSYAELLGVTSSGDGAAVRVLGIKVSDMNTVGNEVELVSAALEVSVDPGTAKARCAPPGAILFPKRGAAIATNKKRIAPTWTVFDPNVIGVVAREGLSQRFLFHWFQAFDLRTITEPGPTPQLNKKNLVPLLLPVPPTLEEQQEIVGVLEALDRKIELHRRKRGVLDRLFESFLHKLMTGEVSVDDLDLSALPKLEGSVA